MSARLPYALPLCLALTFSAPALAAEVQGDPVNNGWALAVQRELLRFGIWTTGIHRLADSELYGLVCAVLIMAFATSGLGIILFKTDGLGFRAGWLVSMLACVLSMLTYCHFRPYPTLADWPSMYLFAGLTAFGCLALGRALKSAIETRATGTGARQPHEPDRGARWKLATRPTKKVGNIT